MKKGRSVLLRRLIPRPTRASGGTACGLGRADRLGFKVRPGDNRGGRVPSPYHLSSPMNVEFLIRISSFALVFAAMAGWELVAPRRAWAVGRAPRWTEQSRHPRRRCDRGARPHSDRGGGRGAVRGRARMGAVPSRRAAGRPRRDPGLSDPRSRHLWTARCVPQGAGAVAVAPHASCRSRHRRHHRRALPPVRDSHFPGDQDRHRDAVRHSSDRGAAVRGRAQCHFDVQSCQRVDAGRARPRVAPAGRDARHAPGASFHSAQRDRQQFRLQSAVVGPAVRNLPRRPRGRSPRHDHRTADLPRSTRAACGPAADAAVPRRYRRRR